jgi:excisionase family DNA binding protein
MISNDHHHLARTSANAETGDLLTVDEVATWLKVPRSWVYARTRQRGTAQLPYMKLGKYVRFEPDAVRAWLARQRASR